jgi:hypothetical protein
MKALGPAWWGGFLLGLFLGVFIASLLVETEVMTTPYVKFLRGGAALGAAITALIGGWRVRRNENEHPGMFCLSRNWKNRPAGLV